MFQPTTECVDSLTIDDVTGQAAWWMKKRVALGMEPRVVGS